MMVTTEMTAATPTTMPINVNAVRSLLARRLAVATRNASQSFLPRKSTKQKLLAVSNLFCAFCAFWWLPDPLGFLDLAVTNRDYAVGAFRDVRPVRDYDDRVAFGVEGVKTDHYLRGGV